MIYSNFQSPLLKVKTSKQDKESNMLFSINERIQEFQNSYYIRIIALMKIIVQKKKKASEINSDAGGTSGTRTPDQPVMSR